MKDDYSAILKELNLKVTPKRLAILEALAESFCCLPPDEIWRKLKEKFNKVGLPNIYKNLEELSECGVLSKVINPDRKVYYYFCRNKLHHCHFICLSCHKVDDLISSNITALQRNIEGLLEGKVLSNILHLNGLCKDCLKNYGQNTHKFHRRKYGFSRAKD